MPCTVCNIFTNGRQHDLTGRPFNQGYTQFILKFLYLGAEGGLADKAGIRRFTEMFQFCKLYKVL